MLTTAEQRAEAERLVDLDERGRLVEAVALALRVAESQESAMAELTRLDRDALRELSGEEHGGSGLSVEGEI